MKVECLIKKYPDHKTYSIVTLVKEKDTLFGKGTLPKITVIGFLKLFCSVIKLLK